MNLSTSSSSDGRLWLTAVQRVRYRVGSTCVVCTLYRVKQAGRPVGYALKAEDPHARYIYSVGCRRASAVALLAMTAAHRVAPCTLGDILADLTEAACAPVPIRPHTYLCKKMRK